MPAALRRLLASDLLTIGEVARRTGLSVSAIRFYEDHRLIEPVRTNGGQRRFLRSDIRRLAFILIAQKLGLSLTEIEAALATLPSGRTPTVKDWEAISTAIRARLDERIAELTRTRHRLDGCIGCGCLSLEHCAIWNPQDKLAEEGPGARKLLA
ncbi:redox-sensitive transcriptional activator SoxR [Erythrobacter sp. CCH5-A1]|jgi:MerR family redox-sensitive transcriptional activator SoxR|uniref:redox-sensitive transcriptional activator SoxR n=1 Tax=Erythrobacter sp. CCH5-A1 TaxID=1768792 RepID=UPI00082F681F|nr:redox-sensitive transcriptional activator SoxR [Erythrobacter sp. CCH5-A1]